MRNTWRLTFPLLLVVFASGAGAAAWAFAQGDSGQQIYACATPAGQVRIVDSLDQCREQETPLTWSVAGPPGSEGPIGPQGDPGEPGANGLNCWDLNGNGDGDPDEDINNDGVVDILDCQGPAGADGSEGLPGAQGDPGEPGGDGLNCWDLDGDGEEDDGEDVNGNGILDTLDCQGPVGQQGLQGSRGDPPRPYVPGLVAYSDPLGLCIQDVESVQCVDTSEISVYVPDNSQVDLEGVQIQQVLQDGEPVEVEEYVVLAFLNHPGSSCHPGIEIEVYVGAAAATICLLPESPIKTFNEESYGQGKAMLLADDLVSITMDVERLRVIETESIGVIVDSANDPPTADELVVGESGELTVNIQNLGDRASTYLTTVTECPEYVEPVLPQLSYLANESAELTFQISSATGLVPGEGCTVSLQATTGRVFHSVPAVFP